MFHFREAGSGQEVVKATDLEDVAFTAIGSADLKGVSQPVELHSARRQP
jgi:hypothetical protein